MVSLRALLKTHILALAVFLAALAVLLPIDSTMGLTGLLAERFQYVAQLLVALSASLIVFPFVSFPAVERVISSAEELGVVANPRLVEDYATGCLVVFMVSLLEVVLVIVYSLTQRRELLYLVFPLLASQLVVVLVIVFFLWSVTSLLWRARGMRGPRLGRR